MYIATNDEDHVYKASVFTIPFHELLVRIDIAMWAGNDDLCTPSAFERKEWVDLMLCKLYATTPMLMRRHLVSALYHVYDYDLEHGGE